MMTNKTFVISLIIIGLILQCFSFVVNVKANEIPYPFNVVTNYAPKNSFGAKSFTEQTVNWTWVNNHVVYTLKRDGVDVTNSLVVNFSTVFTSRKYSYSFTSGASGYFLLTLTFDSKSSSSFIDNVNHIVFFNYSDGQLFYNFSDINGISLVDKVFNLNSNVFVMTVGRHCNKNVKMVFDPTFGYTGTSINNIAICKYTNEDLYGAWSTMGASGGTANNISVKFATLLVTYNYQCALYNYVDYFSSYVGTLVDVTETKSVTSTDDDKVITFNFSAPKPSLSANTKYYLCIRVASATSGEFEYLYGQTLSGYAIYKETAGVVTFDSPLTGELAVTSIPYIYCSYTENASGWSNTVPTISCQSPVNGSTGQSLSKQISICANDTDGNSTTVNWYSNQSGSWVKYQTNNSVTANSTVYWNENIFNTGNTKYWWNVTVDDGNSGGNVSSWSYYTTVANWSNTPPVGGNFSPVNGSVNQALGLTVSLSCNDSDGNSTTVNFYENSTGSWLLRQTNNSVVANTSVYWIYSFASGYSTKYWWNVTIDDGNSGGNVSYVLYFTTIVTPDTNVPSQSSEFYNISVYWGITLSDNSGSLSYNISCNNSQYKVGSSVANNTYYIQLFGLSLNCTYTMNVKVNDSSHNWNNQTYYFNLNYSSTGGTGSCSGVVWVNYSDINVSFNVSVDKATDANTSSYKINETNWLFVGVGSNMEITLGISTLGILLTLVIFAFAYYSDRDKLLKPILFFFDVPLCIIVGMGFLYGADNSSLSWWIGLIWICLSGIISFAGLYYSLNYGRK